MAKIFFGVYFLFVVLKLVNGQGAVCPVCTDKYDYDSCTGSEQCSKDGDFCSLTVHTADSYSVNYTCLSFAECQSKEQQECHPEKTEACFYCCDDVVTCQIQRDDLFVYVFPPNLATPGDQSTATPATAAPTGSTHPTADATQTTVAPPTPAGTGLDCVSCGFFPRRIPCTEMELVFEHIIKCPPTTPYCYTTFHQNGTDVQVFKGCAADDFCSLEYQVTSERSECVDPDITVPKDTSCGFCCNQEFCNASLRPDNSTLVIYP